MPKNSDRYVYPGTSLLKNLRDIRDRKLFERFEWQTTTRRLIELEGDFPVGAFDADRLARRSSASAAVTTRSLLS